MTNIRHNLTAILVLIVLQLSVVKPGLSGEPGLAPYWVYFNDKGHASQAEINSDLRTWEKNLLPEARMRRSRAMKSRLVDFADLQVNSRYISEIETICGTGIRHSSRWLNSVSIMMSPGQVHQVRILEYVKSVEPVKSYHRLPRQEPDLEEAPIDNLPRRDYDLDYGSSLRQNLFMNVPAMHDLGFRGRGLLIGLLDAGFNNLDHDCFQRLEVVAAYDFVNDDDNVGDEDDLGRGDHGTKTLSIIAGYDPGQMIGIAHEAAFVLGKTENTDWEREIEEDHWVAGIEWMDSLGVEIVSSSLTYSNWYDYEDMDGNTAVTTRAADRAVAVGMVVVISMGNQGMNRHPNNKMGAPADGDSALAIGATNRDSSRAGFSSIGPTWDGRIKPDFTTYGSSVRFASAIHDDVYGGGAGTSFSAPAIAGLIALLIQANPYLSPMEIRDILRETSHMSEEPDTLMGWGIPDVIEAYQLATLEEIELLIPLHAGWNTVSHNLDIIPNSMQEIFSEIVQRNNLFLVKDGEGNFYSPNENFCSIAGWYGYDGYQVCVIEDDELLFEGRLTAYNTPVFLNENWQIISYLPNFNLAPKKAMESLVENQTLVLVKDEWGRFYTPEYDYCNIPEMRPGRGYHVKLSEDDILYYPRIRIDDHQPVQMQIPTHFPLPEPGSANMSLLVIAGDGVVDGDEIGCFDSYGRLLGSGIFHESRSGLALWCDNPLSDPVFRIWNNREQKFQEPIPYWISGSGKIIPGELGVAKLSLNQSEIAIDGSHHFSVSPNPFNDRFTASFHAESGNRLELNVFDMTGRRVYQNKATAEKTGNAEWSISTGSWAGGSYVIQCEIDGKRSEIIAMHLK